MVFSTRRSIGKLWIMMAGFGIFIPIGIIIMLTSDLASGLAMMGFGLVPQLFFLYSVLSPGSVYSVFKDTLVLKRGGSKLEISLTDVSAAEVLTETQANDILQRFMAPAVKSERELDIKNWVKSNRKYGELVRYCTVPIVQQHTSAGHSRNIVSFGAKASGSFVLLRLTNGAGLILSPADPGAFCGHLQKIPGIGRDTHAEAFAPAAIDAERVERSRSAWRVYRYTALAVTLVAAAVVIYFTQTGGDIGGQGSEAGNTAEIISEEPAWVNGDTFRVPVSVEITDPTVTGIEDRQSELLRLFKLRFLHEAAGAIVTRYEFDHDTVLSAGERRIASDRLIELVNSLIQEFVDTSVDDDYSNLTAVYDIRGESFRNQAEEIIESVSRSPSPR